MNSYKNILFIVGIFATALPILFIKEYNKTENIKWIFLSMISYLTLIYVYSVLISEFNVIVFYTLLKILSVLLVVFIGITVFNEKISQRIILGLIFSIISIYLLCC
jgi:multidrug transporter EmrE-like cation transporter